MRANNFDAMRVFAALLVLLSHSVQVAHGTNDYELLFRLSHGQATFGQLAVAVFFVISGYLITQSYDRSQNAFKFVLARVLRLLPALAIMVLLLAVVAGPLLSTLPVSIYFTSPAVPRFIASNLTLVGYGGRLPGVFESNPAPYAVNAPLWTLGYEGQCYGLILLLGVVGWLNRWTVTALFCSGLAASLFWPNYTLITFGLYFTGGAMMYLWQPALRAWVAILCAALLVGTMLTGGFRQTLATAGAYLVVYLALAARPIRWPERTDLSYGIYIWAWPVQQCASLALGGAGSWWANAMISLPIVLGLAWLSWHFVEAPALALKRTLTVSRWSAAALPWLGRRVSE